MRSPRLHPEIDSSSEESIRLKPIDTAHNDVLKFHFDMHTVEAG